MEPKPEPWWPLKWNMWVPPRFSVAGQWQRFPGSGEKSATLRDHPCIRTVVRDGIDGNFELYPNDPMAHVAHVSGNGGMLALRAVLYNLAYPEGNDDDET